MDPVSLTASVVALIQLTGTVLGYLNDVKDAPKECQQCAIEASNLLFLLTTFRYRLEQARVDEPWFTAVRALNVENGPLDQYKQAFESLSAKIENQDGFHSIKKRLLWKFSKTEISEILARVERLKTLMNIALEGDHFKLSQAIKDDTSVIRDSISTLQVSTFAIRDAQSTQHYNAIMHWLSPTNFPAQQHDIIARKEEGTGKWFLNSAEFQGWQQGSHKTLFSPGIPGAGKTMMAAIVIDHLCSTTSGSDMAVACIFCNYKTQSDQSVSSLLAALLKQLVHNRPDLAAPVTQLYNSHSQGGSKPSLSELLRTLQSVCLAYATVYIVVDALDECSNADGAREQLIDKLREVQAQMDLRLLCTSRFLPEITRKFQSDPILEVQASDADVVRFIVAQMPRLPGCIQRDEELKRTVQNKIVEAAQGMFLLVRLHVDSLRDKRNKQKVLSTLNKFAKGSEALHDAYGEALERIDGQLPEDRLLARRTISWISNAQRPLTTIELLHALAIEPGDTALNLDNIYDKEDIISVCAGLVTVDEESSVVRLVHYTTQEYFEEIRLQWFPAAQEEIALACLTCLSFNEYRSGSCDSLEAMQRRITENPLFQYAARNWDEHVRLVESSTSVAESALAFLSDEALMESAIQGEWQYWSVWQHLRMNFPIQTSGLHLISRYGLAHLAEKRLAEIKQSNRETEVNAKNSYVRTPLSIAARYGYPSVVQLLLDNGADLESKDGDSRTPLAIATESGHEVVVRLLLEKGANIESRDKYGRTPLLLAILWKQEAVVNLLLEKGADLKVKFLAGNTALGFAVQKGNETITKLLLAKGVDPGSDVSSGLKPLSLAVRNNREEVAKILLAQDGVDPNCKDYFGLAPLSWATINGNMTLVGLLLREPKIEADPRDEIGRTPLSYAAGHGFEAGVRLLVERDDVKADSKDVKGWTPLSYAVYNENEDIIQLLRSLTST